VRTRYSALLIALALPAIGCGSDEPQPPLPQGAEPVTLDPADFSTEIDNAYWPMEPGTTWVYRETDGEGSVQRVEVTVTATTRTIMGIEARVVHDVVSEGGDPVEDTFDWYAQDASGNVWYLGEDTKELENGKIVSREGSWEAGVDGAQTGIVVAGEPAVGMRYRQEYYEGHAEDAAEVLSLEAGVRVPYGTFDEVLETRDFTPLDPGLVERKYYAKGVGPVLARTVSGGSDREELVQLTRP
jgi:hypothetical protein